MAVSYEVAHFPYKARKRIAELEAERDKALEALRGLVEADYKAGPCAWWEMDSCQCVYCEAVREARAVLEEA
jgi:hypothetical protein